MSFLDDMESEGTPLSDPRLYPSKGTPRSHQLRALREAGLKTGHCWFADPGAGKTYLSITETSHLFATGKVDGMLIIAPNGVHEQWIDEQVPRWCAVPYTAAHNKMTKTQLREFDAELRRRKDQMGVLSVNYDALRTPTGKEQIEAFAAQCPRFMLIVDESHKVKSPTAQRTKETMAWALRATYRRILSGTPILKGLEDLWAQYEVCEAGLGWPLQPIHLHKGKVNTYGYIGFRTHYCVTKPVPGNPRAQMIVGYRNEAELQSRVARYVTRIKSEEFAVMPEPDIIKVPTPMSEAQGRAYRTMSDQLLAEIDGGRVTAQNALTQLGKLMQIASGFLYRAPTDEAAEYNTGVGWEMLGQNKIEATLDLLDQLDEPVIVWAPFRALQQMIVLELIDRAERKGDTRPFYTYEGRDTIRAWETTQNGILIGNQSSGLGVGQNLQHAAANVYMANTFSAEARWQSIKRTDRIGQTRQVRVWDLTTPHTAEEKVLKALAAKEDISRRNIDGLRQVLL